jgi:hypothetical protein
MLNWLSARLSEKSINHLLGSSKAIDSYLAEMPVANPEHTLTMLDEWLEAPCRLFTELPPQAAIRALCRLDEFSQRAIAECWDVYFADDRRDYLSALVLKKLETHFANVEAAYRLALSLPPAPGEPDRNQLAVFSIRAMAALTARKKIGHFSYQGPNDAWWKSAHELLFLARNLAILQIKQPAYPDAEPSTVWREYMIGLFFEMAPLSNLTPAQVDALDSVVHWAEPHFICVDSFSPQTPFRIHLEKTSGPERCMPGQDENPSYRYFGPAQAHAHIVRLRAMISTSKTPDWMPAHCSKKDVLDLLHGLLQHWSMKPPKRQQNRQEHIGKLLVTRGFSLARRMIAASEFARSGRSLDYKGHNKYLHYLRNEGIDVPEEAEEVIAMSPMESLRRLETTGDRQMMEHWEVIDISEKGLGARLPLRRPWQAIGALVAYRQEQEIDWHIGIIRRLGQSHSKPNAGLNTFEGIPHCGQLHLLNQEDDGPWHQQTADTSGHGMIDAILVSRAARLVLLPKKTFTFDRRADFLLAGQRIPMRLTGIEASGTDYDLVLFRDLEVPATPQTPA